MAFVAAQAKMTHLRSFSRIFALPVGGRLFISAGTNRVRIVGLHRMAANFPAADQTRTSDTPNLVENGR